MQKRTLPQPLLMRMSVSRALQRRRSCRTEPSACPLTERQIATLCWAGVGVTDRLGHRTSPSTRNFKGIRLYMLDAQGVWQYDETKHRLVQRLAFDVRSASTVGQEELVTTAPVTFVMVGDKKRTQRARSTALYVDAGVVVENLYMASTALGLRSVVRASFDHGILAEAMDLPDFMEPMLVYTVMH